MHFNAGTPTTADALCQYLDRFQTPWALMFRVAPLGNQAALSNAAAYVKGAQGRVVFLYQPGAPPFTEFARGDFTEAVLQGILAQGPLRGVGEIGFYYAPTSALGFGSPQMQAVFRAVNAFGGIVMIHPREFAFSWRPQDTTELEAALQSYPNVTFLFHSGRPDVFEGNIMPLMARYQNLFYTFDVNQMLEGPWGNLRDFPDNLSSTQAFVDSVNRVGVSGIVDYWVTRTASWFQLYPDRILWGTDRLFLLDLRRPRHGRLHRHCATVHRQAARECSGRIRVSQRPASPGQVPVTGALIAPRRPRSGVQSEPLSQD